jgi:hypothetical protein
VITQDELKSVLEYVACTGKFYWRERISTSIHIGDEAGTILKSNGYIHIQIYGKQYLAHRLAWLYMYGSLPKKIDHRFGVKTDNRISELREATTSQNAANSNMYSTNTSGFKGVTWNKKARKWQAALEHFGKSNYLGSFVKKEDAANAYREKSIEVFGEFSKV